MLGMVRFDKDLDTVRKTIENAQNKVMQSRYYKAIPSVMKRVNKGGFYFHAKDDSPELRKEFFDVI